MSIISLLGVNIINNPAKFTDSYTFEITFECLEQLTKELEWKLTYVGSATSDQYDQELDSLLVEPIPVGVNKFVFEAKAPDTKRIPDADILGVTVVLLTCTYDGREFVRVGYYVNNEYDSEELANEPPAKPIVERVRRNILAEKPRVTRFAIKWDSDASAPALFPPEQPEADLAPDDEEYGAEERELEAALKAEVEAAEAEAEPEAEAGSSKPAGEDAEMGGVEPAAEAEEAEPEPEPDSDDEGSVDLENDTDDELEEEIEEEAGDGADAMEEDSMDVDTDKSSVATKPVQLPSH